MLRRFFEQANSGKPLVENSAQERSGVCDLSAVARRAKVEASAAARNQVLRLVCDRVALRVNTRTLVGFATSLTKAGAVWQSSQMRLPPHYGAFVKAEAVALRPEADVFLFGSRTDNSRRGGDLDFLVLSSPRLNWEDASRIRRRFWEKFGFQKLDLVCFSPGDRSVFKDLILLDAIRL